MQKRRLFFTGALISAMIIWGISWSAGKLLSSETTPPVLLFWRFTLTFCSLFPVVLILERTLKIPLAALPLVIAGGLIMTLYNYLFFSGLFRGLSGVGGVLVTVMNPVFTFIFSSLLMRHRPRRLEIAGLTLGLLGGLIMIRIWHFSLQELVATGNIFFVTASIAWAFMTLLTQYSGKRVGAVQFSFYVHLFAALFAFGWAPRPDLVRVFSFAPSFWYNLIYLSVISTTFATTIYFIASQKLGSRTASSFIFIVPMSALLSGIFFLNEKVDLLIVSGGVFSLVAVYLINLKPAASVNKN